MTEIANPLKAEQFLNAVRARLAPAKGTYIYDACIRDYLEKTSSNDSSGYVRWFKHLLPYLSQQHNASNNKLLDIGCGTGELTVLMKLIGFDAIGLDVHEKDIQLAKLLAKENGLSEQMFVLSDGSHRLPFDNQAFDIVTMISVLEHVNDVTLAGLVPEIARICRRVLYVQVPNKLSISDNHTGLRFVPWMPHWMAKHYISARGAKYKYWISASGSWDVFYRNFEDIAFSFGRYFDCSFCPPDCSFPVPTADQAITKIGKNFRIFSRKVFVGLPLPWRWIRMKRGYPRQAYYPYLNLIFTPKSIAGGGEKFEG